jgi:hypothetical protein
VPAEDPIAQWFEKDFRGPWLKVDPIVGHFLRSRSPEEVASDEEFEDRVAAIWADANEATPKSWISNLLNLKGK